MSDSQKTPQQIGKQNKRRGDSFEALVAGRAEILGLDLLVKRIDRTHRRGISLPDVEIIDFPEFMVDCKFTEGSFSIKEKTKLLLECQSKYCCSNSNAVIVCGEKKDRSRLIMEDVLVCFLQQDFITMTSLDCWFQHLHNVKMMKLNRMEKL